MVGRGAGSAVDGTAGGGIGAGVRSGGSAGTKHVPLAISPAPATSVGLSIARARWDQVTTSTHRRFFRRKLAIASCTSRFNRSRNRVALIVSA